MDKNMNNLLGVIANLLQALFCIVLAIAVHLLDDIYWFSFVCVATGCAFFLVALFKLSGIYKSEGASNEN